MKKVLFSILLSLLLPLVVSAQFTGRIHDLKIPRIQQFQEKITKEITKVIDNNDVALIVLDSIIILNGITDSNIIKNYLTQDSLNKNTLKQKLITTSTETFTSLFSGDSMITEYLKLVGAKATDTIGSLQAKYYREIIDKDIVNAHKFQKTQYELLSNPDYSLKEKRKKRTCEREDDSVAQQQNSWLPKLIPDSIQNHSYKIVVDSVNRIQATRKVVHQARNYFNYLYRSEDNPVSKPWLLPLKSITHAEFFYFGENGKQLQLLTHFNLQSNFSNNSTVSAEIISGILPFEAGGKKNPRKRTSIPLKFNLGTTISQTEDTFSREKTTDKLLYGGLLHAQLSYPIFYSNWRYHNNKGIRFYIPIIASINWENSKLETQLIKDMFYFGEAALQLYSEADLIQNQNIKETATLFLNGKIAFIDGGKNFYNNLQAGRYGLWLLQINAGLRVRERFTIAVNIPIWSSQKELTEKKGASVAILIDPNF